MRRQSVPAEQLVVVVDHNRRLYERLLIAEPDVLVLENDLMPGASGARNTGARAARTQFIAFLDDDAAAAPDWLANIVLPFADPHVVGTGGRVLPRWHTVRPDWFPEEFDWVVGASYVGMPTETATVRNVWAENMAVRRDVFESVHGFRTGFGKLGGHSRPEDTDVCIRMAESVPQGRWVYTHDAVVGHFVPAGRSTYQFFIRRTFHEGRGKAELARLLPIPSAALSCERDYVRKTLPVGVVAHLARAVTALGVGELAKSANIVVGLGSTVAGFAVQETVERFGRRPVLLVDSNDVVAVPLAAQVEPLAS